MAEKKKDVEPQEANAKIKLRLDKYNKTNNKDMGFFGNIIGDAVNVAVSPIAVVIDGVALVTGNEPTNTGNLIVNTVEKLGDAVEDLTKGDI